MGRGVHCYHASSPSLMILRMVGNNPASQLLTPCVEPTSPLDRSCTTALCHSLRPWQFWADPKPRQLSMTECTVEIVPTCGQEIDPLAPTAYKHLFDQPLGGSHRRCACARLSHPYMTCSPHLLTRTFTPTAFARSSFWLFEAFPSRVTSKGLPASLVQHDACALRDTSTSRAARLPPWLQGAPQGAARPRGGVSAGGWRCGASEGTLPRYRGKAL